MVAPFRSAEDVPGAPPVATLRALPPLRPNEPAAVARRSLLRVATGRSPRNWLRLAAVNARLRRHPRVQQAGLLSVRGRLPHLAIGGDLVIGRSVGLSSCTARSEVIVEPGARLVLGDRTYVNQGVVLHACRSITIGADVLLASGVCVTDSNHHEVEEGAGVRVAPVVIEDNVWVGRGATVLPGVRIGRNSVIGAGAVVTCSIPADVVAAGIPATVVRSLRASEGYVRS